MMDALSAPRLPASDGAVGQQTGGRSERTEDGGFSKVLSSSGQKERGGRDDNTAAAEQSDAEAGDAQASIKGLSAGDRQLLIDMGGNLSADLEALSADISVDDLARLLAAAKAQARGDSKEGKEPEIDIRGLDPKLKAELAKALAAARERNGAEEGEQTAAGEGLDEAATSETKGPDLSDVLQLLAGVDGAKTALDDQRTTAEPNGKDDQKQKMLDGLPVTAVIEDSADSSTSDKGKDEGERDFRFIRADGKGQPLLLRSEAAAGAQETEPKTVETVTVVDSRRYIAPISTTNGASITAAMLGDSEWVSAMSPGSELANAATHSSQGKVVHTLKIQMSPIELGSVTATLRLSGEELSVQLTVDNPAALRQLQNDQSDILKALKAQGLVVDQVQVNMQLAPADRSTDAGQNGTSNQQSGQQASQFANQGGSERQQRGESAGNGVRMADERTVQTSDAPTVDARGARPDQLYV
ncbi:hypothetical protein GVN24_10085 [Rhizobium sp. CRIBSB]|nr:hypothetical protein [Rhizobium sp. CRIBSB]